MNIPSLKKWMRFLFFLSLVLGLSSCEDQKKTTWPGYVEGKYLFISSTFSGTLKSLAVKSGDKIKADTVLYTLDSENDQEEINTAKARLNQATADEHKASSEYDLQKKLYDRKKNKSGVSKDDLDISKTNSIQAKDTLSSAKANVEALKAQLNKLEWARKQKTTNAPIDAIVFETYFQTGENINSGTPIVALLAPNQIKAIFYVQGSDLRKIKLNQLVKIKCDHCDQAIDARISFISPQAEFTPPVLYSSELSSKLTFRVEAQPVEQSQAGELLPGQPINVML